MGGFTGGVPVGVGKPAAPVDLAPMYVCTIFLSCLFPPGEPLNKVAKWFAK